MRRRAGNGKRKINTKSLVNQSLYIKCKGEILSPYIFPEFPAILYNLQKRQKESEFREFVKPTERPKLSEFCTNLTGITQDLVDNGNIITEVLNRFHDWLADILTRKKLCLPKTDIDNLNGNIAFVTWSDWDFGVCLKRELTRKSIKKPLYYNNWIDLQAVYKVTWLYVHEEKIKLIKLSLQKKYHYRPMNFSDSLRHLNMEFEGRPHCGMDDAKNLARLAGRLADDGALIAITTDLQPQRILYRPFFSY